MYLPNVNGDDIVESVTQMLGGREQLQILHLKMWSLVYVQNK